MNRRKRVDGMAGKAEVVKDALSGPPSPPAGVNITDDVLPFWEIVTMAKAKRAWTKNDLVVAADIARCMARLEKIHAVLDSMPVYSDDKERAKEISEMEKRADILAKRVRILSAHIQIHSDATQGKSRKQTEQNKTHHEAVNFADGEEDDFLLAKPMH